MNRVLFTAILISACAFGQTGPAFEAADVHKSPAVSPGTNQFMRGGFYRGGRYEVRTATMVDLIHTAYGIDADKVTGGPAWLATDRFDVIAKAPADSTADTLKTMLKNLLTDRFSLVAHNDTKPLPAYALVQGKKVQMKPADGPGDTGCKMLPSPEPPPGAGGGRMMISNGSTVMTFTVNQLLVYNCRNVTMPMLTGEFSKMLFGNSYLNNYPVVDQTELKGEWNFDLRYSLKIQMMGSNADTQTVTLFDAVEKQLGLKLELTKVPTPVIAVDSVNQTPTPNLPGVTEKMPEMPTEFEVADIKPSNPEPQMGPRMNTLFQPGGRVNIQDDTLQQLISMAWNLNGNASNMIVGGPKFMETDRWTILAKASTTAPLNVESGGLFGPGPAQTVDFDSMRIMLQNLLKDRFKLKLHEEERPMAGYALVAVKPKLKKADPSNRAGCNEGPGPDGKDPRTTNPAAGRLFSCLNTTMADLAALLPNRAGGYFQQFPGGVVDATKLEGAYDFTLNFSGAGMVGGGGRGGREGGAGAGATGEASDPGGAISLQEAIEKQLGLKLEPQKNKATVLVIDHVEQKPTEN